MTSKIAVVMLRKNRTAEHFKVGPDEQYFKRRNNLYMLPKEAISTIDFENGKNNPHSELIYIEGDPIPQTATATFDGNTFLENLVIENVINSTAQPRSMFFSVIVEYIRSPGKLLMLSIVFIIIGAVAAGLAGGF